MEHYSFFDSIVKNGVADRSTRAIDFDRHFKDLFTNGVFLNQSTNLQVMADGSRMTVALSAGPAWINGKKYDNDAPLPFAIDIADTATARIDRLVIRLDYDNRQIYAAVKKGTYAQIPVAPGLQRDADAYELGLADIAVAAGATEIRQADITDLRLNSDLCGIVAATVQQLDTSAFYAQLQAYFNEQKTTMTAQEQAWANEFLTWFSGIKGQLGTDVAGNLQNQINNITSGAGNLEAQINSITSGVTKVGSAAAADSVGGKAPADFATAAQGREADAALPANGGTIQNYSEALTSIALASGAVDLSGGNTFNLTLKGNITVTLPTPESDKAYSISILLHQGSTAYSVTWPACVKWPSDSIPTFTAGKAHIITLFTVNGGAIWRGSALTDYAG